MRDDRSAPVAHGEGRLRGTGCGSADRFSDQPDQESLVPERTASSLSVQSVSAAPRNGVERRGFIELSPEKLCQDASAVGEGQSLPAITRVMLLSRAHRAAWGVVFFTLSLFF